MSITGVERNNELNALLCNRWSTYDFVLWKVKIHQNFLFLTKWFQFNEIYDKPGPKKLLWTEYNDDVLSRPTEIILNMAECKLTTEEEREFLGECPECVIFSLIQSKFNPEFNINLKNVTLASDEDGDAAIDDHCLVLIFAYLSASDQNFQLHKISLELKDIVKGMRKNALKDFLETQTKLKSLELSIVGKSVNRVLGSISR